MSPKKKPSRFTQFAKSTARVSGRPAAFILATLVILVWAISDPFVPKADLT